ncbi:MAG: AAA family ATPase [Peptostreptococcaceae bacterium]|nr:AAA family ATPase [Peptostreptococcaceae bacterium]
MGEHVTRDRTRNNIEQFSNGETALKYFDYRFLEGKIYLLDEPENSLSPKFQLELMKLIIDCTYYCNCQFIIATHSPFLLSLTDARVYDLDNVPAKIKNWQELDNVKLYHELFSKNAHLFD